MSQEDYQQYRQKETLVSLTVLEVLREDSPVQAGVERLSRWTACYFCPKYADVLFEGDPMCYRHASDGLSQRLTNLVNVARGTA